MKGLDINFHAVRQQTRNVGFAVLIVKRTLHQIIQQ